MPFCPSCWENLQLESWNNVANLHCWEGVDIDEAAAGQLNAARGRVQDSYVLSWMSFRLTKLWRSYNLISSRVASWSTQVGAIASYCCWIRNMHYQRKNLRFRRRLDATSTAQLWLELCKYLIFPRSQTDSSTSRMHARTLNVALRRTITRLKIHQQAAEASGYRDVNHTVVRLLISFQGEGPPEANGWYHGLCSPETIQPLKPPEHE